MPVRAEEQKNEAVEAVAALATRRLGDGRAAAVARFVRRFYSHVPPEDILARAPEDLYGAALSLWRFAETRLPGRAKLRVVDPRAEEEGWRSPRTIVEIVNDDMPFLVDSVAAALAGEGFAVHLVIHPILRVERDGEGKLTELIDDATGNGNGAGLRESFMHVEISAESGAARVDTLPAVLERVLGEVRAAVMDWAAMRARVQRIVADLAEEPPPLVEAERKEAADFLAWLDDANFTFLGFREYRFGAGEGSLDIVPGSGLGILRDDAYPVFDGLRNFATLPPDVRQFLREPRLLLITKSNRRAVVHRPVHMDAICIKSFDSEGHAIGERLVVGLFTSLAYSRSPRAIPLLRRKVERTLERAGFDPASHDGKALSHILDTYPRDELFQIGEDELLETAMGILHLQERQRVALFVRRDPFERFVSCLVYVPRERYDTALRQRFAAILERAFSGTIVTFNTQLDDSVLGRVHFILRTTPGRLGGIDVAAIERDLAEAGRSWADRIGEALREAKGEAAGSALLRRYADAFPTAYRERFGGAAALADIDQLEELQQGAPIAVTLYRAADGDARELRFKIYRAGTPVALSEVLPVLEHLGLKVLTETPYVIAPAGAGPAWMQDFSLTIPSGEVDVARDRARFEEAFRRLWSGSMESDGLNRLVLMAGLDWRQVVVLRLYVKVLRQAGGAYSQAYMEDALSAYPAIARNLVALFERRFDPKREKGRDADQAKLVQAIEGDLDAVQSLDEDRILRSFLLLVRKSLRTNYYQRTAQGEPKPYLSVKLLSRDIDLLPLPRPLYEIYVLSPRVEGVHLRGSKVARGGIRWSDRKEDFRTEILGLMKAQMVKNAVIVPTGSKGGFVVKRPPPPSDPKWREAFQAEGVECYKTLLRGLLDVTDNFSGAGVMPPRDVVRHDADDPYLVVAADKGTATFSDIANSVSAEYGFWLGDAFASGGSAGYDHKAMGITARGAWEAVKRHFREIGTDIQTTDFTAVGVGDMSGDVFGNGMLRSKHTKLIAAFDHRHIFLDPDPDPAASFAERQRLFALPRSSWADYNAKLISKGGGVFERTRKSIALSPEIAARLGVSAEKLTPAELMQAILKAPVDLLWFGGIGTYVKSAAERHAEVGDRANDALRIDAEEIRAAVVGEGANLAVTQRARVAYALKGGRINSDAIDNSAGVDTSDHEVNIKILLDAVVAAGDLTTAQRNAVLQEMTDAVAELVLADNYLQTLALSLAEAQGTARLDEQLRTLRALERAGELSRPIEFLPDDDTLITRAASGRGLTRPELAVLMAYVKNTLVDALGDSDLPDDPQLETYLKGYFPPLLVERFPRAVAAHRLRREIIATVVANDMVNRGGITFVQEMRERTGRSEGDVARAYAIVKEIFGFAPLWAAINALDNKVAAAVQAEMLLTGGRLIERATAWFLRGRGLDIRAQVDAFGPRIAELAEHIVETLPDVERNELERRVDSLVAKGVPRETAFAVARLDFLTSSVDVVRLASASKMGIVDLARRFYAIGHRFRLDTLRLIARGLKSETSWQKLAVNALIEDFYAQQAELTQQSIAQGSDLDRWLAGRAPALAQIDALLRDIEASPAPDLAMLTVASRALRASIG
ncbi:MAG TPA: NAD-glutamate dehydrogenase [Stellaceae bacterium]|nr:NAD-glutamate dehydrogenase [Stellaceae bacterium]